MKSFSFYTVSRQPTLLICSMPASRSRTPWGVCSDVSDANCDNDSKKAKFCEPAQIIGRKLAEFSNRLFLMIVQWFISRLANRLVDLVIQNLVERSVRLSCALVAWSMISQTPCLRRLASTLYSYVLA